MSRHTQMVHESTETFICVHCRKTVVPPQSGTMNRNHCPHCLYSLHLDMRPGDRRSGCKGDLEPIAIWVQPNGEWSIIHRCVRCGMIKTNRIAGDDDETVLLALAAKPLSQLPFPIEMLTDTRRRSPA